ncbi:MAG: response regulator transcription factor [Planctomycetes bacterium]|nr:response regulator transcription factor [Planctomycetota bacterium]
MEQHSVLIVEDEKEIAELIELHLKRAGIRTAIARSGRAALESVKKSPPDALVLDLMLPDVDGLEVCRRLRQTHDQRTMPIIMVTAKGEESEIVTGIELGADDYITKPFSPKVLVARVQSALRRTRMSAPVDTDRMSLLGGDLVIDSGRHVVLLGGKTVDLTLTEYGILQFLAKRPGFVRTRDQIIAAVHGRDIVLSNRTVDVHITALRRKMGAVGDLIETVRGVGYRFSESREALAE